LHKKYREISNFLDIVIAVSLKDKHFEVCRFFKRICKTSCTDW